MPVSATSPPPSGFSTGATFIRRAPRAFPNMDNANDNISTNSSSPSVLISHNASASSITIGNNAPSASSIPIRPSPSTSHNNTQQATTHQNGKTCFDCHGVYPFRACPKHRHVTFTSGTSPHDKDNSSPCSLQQTPEAPDTSIKDIDNIQHHGTVTALSRDNDLEYYDTDDDSHGSSCDLLDDDCGTQSAVQPKIALLASRGEDERWVNLSRRRMKPGKMGHLHSGSQFFGVQKGAASNYDVTVDIQHVDLENDVLCGYLHVTGLTTFPPKITTFFEGEIIGHKHSFLTRKWHADLSVDSKHWVKNDSHPSPALPIPSMTTPLRLTRQIKTLFICDGRKSSWYQIITSTALMGQVMLASTIFATNDPPTLSMGKDLTVGLTVDGVGARLLTHLLDLRFYYCRNNIEWYQELILSHVPQRQFESFEFR
ncbi:hypothetical protein [Absidia glauca]|uniref:Uncharacterized protein n=1 Tax=Absidia glauca TaxID=4829 RepID=A0A168L0Y2_ABSGL|nr:hypothetical protein [Absidia glauca]